MMPKKTLKGKLLSFGKNGDACTGKLNHVFFVTCIASFLLQLMASLASWHNVHQMSQVFMEEGISAQRSLRVPSDSVAADQILADDITMDSESSRHILNPEEKILPNGRLRVLMGILTADFPNDHSYRNRHRKLFKLWNDPRVCSLPEFKARPIESRYECELIWAFVLGGNPDAPSTELVDGSRPMEMEKPIPNPKGTSDLNNEDMILLNIQENMNGGKSQTWMKYGSEIAEEYDLDYVAKCDADSLLHLHEFFRWAYIQLPPAPYNRNVYIGALRDKAYWPKHESLEDRIRYESYFGQNFEGVHLYVAGQFYMMSKDLAAFTGHEALVNKCSYCEGHEDHDISAMAFHSPDPIKLMVIGRPQRFWEHPVKGEPRWRRIWAREKARMAGEPFEGKIFFKNSSLQDVLAKKAV